MYTNGVNNGFGGYYPQPTAQQNSQPFASRQTFGSYIPQTTMYSSGLPGRIVSTPDEITPQEVRMDGSVSIFPMQDYSCIYAKSWTPDGRINTYKFVPEQNIQGDRSAQDPYTMIMARLDEIDKKLENRQGYYSKNQKRQNNQNRKEEVSDES